jgi:hypothetical protein
MAGGEETYDVVIVGSGGGGMARQAITTAVPPLRIVPSDQPIGAPW